MNRPLLIVALAALAGCANSATLATDFSTLTTEIATAHNVTNCAPVDLAMADANFEFVKVEFEEGNTRRAREHLDLARQHAKVAAACAAVPIVAPKPVEAPKPTVTDTDGDGVPDGDDACPRDTEDLDSFKDGDGCPELDNDNDGVMDMADRCAMEAEDRDNWQDTDGCPELDNDNDSLVDTQDACPNEPGALSDKGCPVYDRDHDSVADTQDRCPTDPETANGYLDDDGCPDTKPQRVEITADQIVIKQRINFSTGKAVILADSFVVLDDVAQVMRDYPQLRVEIGGHTDNVGDDNANQRLSKARADAVFEYLLRKGVAAQRMTTVGYGETRPLDTNMTEPGRNNNRRVEFVIQKDGGAAPGAPAPSPWQ